LAGDTTVKNFIVVTLSVIAIIFFFVGDSRPEEVRVEVPNLAAIRVTRILDAVIKFKNAPETASPAVEWAKVERAVARLLNDNTPAADEALVALTQFYVGESTSRVAHTLQFRYATRASRCDPSK
jgi:hypothetical protein